MAIPTLTEKIIRKIYRSNGKISFYDYMNLALYSPKLGYYKKNACQFGKMGDFITAPEISDLFGHCIARSIQPILPELENFCVLELGAGTGKLTEAFLSYMDRHAIKPKQYFIFDISPALRNLQKKNLRKLKDRYNIIWLNHWQEAQNHLQTFEGLILVNEVIDAFPVRRFCWQNGQLYQYYVSHEVNHDDAYFDWQLHPYRNKKLFNLMKSLSLPDYYTSEFHPDIAIFIQKLSQLMTKGVILCIDYGFPASEFYHPDRKNGTLMCHYKHTVNTNPLCYPGEQDITAHVDFTALAESALNAKLEIMGYTSQGAFLLETGITDCEREYTDKDKQAIKLLTLPHEMGELFKVMALSKQIDHCLTGFQLNPRLYQL